ncbi:hypothetical protein NMY22_g13524 [Coprinellus aureogranulatus]|nr:hypothetical protein NMY22_g13524 [Coprinellus aureogranulatus]
MTSIVPKRMDGEHLVIHSGAPPDGVALTSSYKYSSVDSATHIIIFIKRKHRRDIEEKRPDTHLMAEYNMPYRLETSRYGCAQELVTITAVPKPSRVHQYTQDELDELDLSEPSEKILKKKPLTWQIDSALGILAGDDVIVDVGTGNGKSLTFQLPLLVNDSDVNLVVCPLTVLIIDQASSAPLSTIAVCSETIESVGRDAMFKAIVEGQYRMVIVSPEIVVSPQFSRGVLSQAEFTRRLRSVCIDEAHCISLWGGSFRPDYAALGVLRGRLPSHIPFLVASATLPSHVLDDIRVKLRLSEDARVVSLSNDRPNVALSVKVKKHSEESKGDLRFLIPEDAVSPSDIPQAAIYCNQRLTCEDAADKAREWAKEAGILGDPSEFIVFYHAKVGSKRKREIEEGIRNGRVRLVFCTDALGMGCDFRNLERVILWDLPPSFCALAQRAGRAARDMDKDGDAILFVSSSVLKKSLKELEVDVDNAILDVELTHEAENHNDEDVVMEEEQGTEMRQGEDIAVTEEAGVRVAHEVEDENEVSETTAPSRRRLRTKEEYNSREARYLSLYVAGKRCRRGVWNEFFGNSRKRQLTFGETTLFKGRAGLRCCDVCQPYDFPIPKVKVSKPPGLKRGRKRVLPEALSEKLGKELRAWRDSELFEMVYGAGSRESLVVLPSSMVLGDDVIERVISCGIRIETEEDLRRNVRWHLGFDKAGKLNERGSAMIRKLAEIYHDYDDEIASMEPGGVHGQYLQTLAGILDHPQAQEVEVEHGALLLQQEAQQVLFALGVVVGVELEGRLRVCEGALD